MARDRNALKVGTFTIIVVGLLFFVLIWISRGIGGKMQTVRIRFAPSPAMPTLVPGSLVFVGGQKVGKVTHAELRPIPPATSKPSKNASDFEVIVEAEIRDFIRLQADCVAVAEGPPLGGDGMIKLDLGTAPEPYDTTRIIQGAQPGGFAAILASLQTEFQGDDPTSLLGQIKMQLDAGEEASIVAQLNESMKHLNMITSSLAAQLSDADKATLMAKFHRIVDNVNDTTTALRGQFDPNERDVLLSKVNDAIDALNEGLETATRIVKATEEPVGRTLEYIEETSANVAHETDATRADSLMAHFRQAGDKLNTSLDDVNTVTRSTREVMVLNRENINRMLVNFKESSDHLKTGVKYVLLHPWRLLNAPSPTEMKQQAVFDAARSFAEAATRLDDASSQLKALAQLHEGAIPLDDPDLVRIRDDLARTRDQYRRAETELWRLLKID